MRAFLPAFFGLFRFTPACLHLSEQCSLSCQRPTRFYGLFSACVLWSREPGRHKGDRFEWRTAVWSLQVPMIRALYERLVIPTHVRALGLEELLGLTGEVLNRVDTASFFMRFEEDTAGPILLRAIS